MITIEQLHKIYKHAGERCESFIDSINDAMDEFEINTPLREAHFLAQVGHESGELRYVKELATGKAYEGRKDLGNTQDGDGPRFKGRGLIQITGRYNYRKLSIALDIDCEKYPELLENRANACRSAAWFWKTNGLNELADKDDFIRITKRINGGTNGLEDRKRLLDLAKAVLP